MVKLDWSKIYTVDKLKFLKENETVINLATIMLKILSKYEPDQINSRREERYEDIHSCLETHSNNLDNFEVMIEELHEYLQKAKEIIYNESLYIHENTKLEEVKSQFIRILGKIEPYIRKAKNIIESIENLNLELLYCFFNYETWGSTWCSEMHIPKKILLSANDEKNLN